MSLRRQLQRTDDATVANISRLMFRNKIIDTVSNKHNYPSHGGGEHIRFCGEGDSAEEFVQLALAMFRASVRRVSYPSIDKLAVILILPTIVAFARRHPNRRIFLLLNIFLGATGIVWLGWPIWAFKAVHITKDPTGKNGGESGLNLTANDVRRVRLESHRCRRRRCFQLSPLVMLSRSWSA